MAAILTATESSALALDLLLVLAVSIAVAFHSYRTRPHVSSHALSAFMLAVAVWALAHLLAHLDPASALFPRLRWLGAGFVAFIWFAFVLQYVGRDHLVNRWAVGFLLAWPALVNLLIWLPDLAGAIGIEAGVSVWSDLDGGTGDLYWTQVALSFGMYAAGTALLLVYSWRARSVLRRQGLAILLGIAALWVGIAMAALEPFGGLQVHFLPVGLAVAGLSFLWVSTRGSLLELMPVVTTAVLQTMDAGVLVTDADGRLVELNRAARNLFDLSEREGVVGKSLATVLSSSTIAPGASQLRGEDATSEPVTLSLGDRVIQVTSSTIRTDRGRVSGHVYLCKDVTGQFIQQSELKRKNERFKEFARIVGHDLKNPLKEAQKRLEQAREEVASDHHDDVVRAHDRLDALFDDLQTLVQEGEEVTTLEPIDLGDVVKASWRKVDTAKATIVVQTNQRIRADRGRLLQLLENLFRNSIQHGGEDVTISVGAIDGGFYVEDDGPGIPSDSREQVLESGYSTSDVGTGFGLAIVERIAEAHGWAVAVTDGDDGGARFEFEGIDPAT